MKPLPRGELRAALVKRRPEDHKGTFGHVLIVAGSRGMAGAALLCTRAALRSGAGLVTLALPAGLQAGVAPQVPEAMTMGLPENATGSLKPEAAGKLKAAQQERGYTALAIGPGLSRHPDTARFLILALDSLPLPTVLDADALNLLAAQEPRGVKELLRRRRQGLICTPHPGEMARCLGVRNTDVLKDRKGCVERLAGLWGCVAVLKGHGTLISDGVRTVVNSRGGPGLAKGGSGDVLTGLVAGLWAQMIASERVLGDRAFLAAALGCHLHGAAGEAAEKARTPWAMTAADVVDFLPRAFAAL